MRDISTGVAARRKYPTGSYARVTRLWQESVRAEIRDRGQTLTWLAGQVSATKGAISQMLHPAAAEEGRTSRLVEPVCRVLDLPPPGFDDERDHEFHEMGRRLREVDPRLYDELFARMRRRVNRTDE